MHNTLEATLCKRNEVFQMEIFQKYTDILNKPKQRQEEKQQYLNF